MLAVGMVSIRVLGMQQNKVKGKVCVDQGKVTLSKRGVAHGIGGEAGPKVVRNSPCSAERRRHIDPLDYRYESKCLCSRVLY